MADTREIDRKDAERSASERVDRSAWRLIRGTRGTVWFIWNLVMVVFLCSVAAGFLGLDRMGAIVLSVSALALWVLSVVMTAKSGRT